MTWVDKKLCQLTKHKSVDEETIEEWLYKDKN